MTEHLSTFAQMRERLNKVLQVNGKISFGSAIEADDWYRNGDIFGDLAVLLDLVDLYTEYVELVNEGNAGAISLAHVHGWRCPDEIVNRGSHYRDRIAQLISSANPQKYDDPS